MKKKIKCEVEGYEDIMFEVGQQWKTRSGYVVEIDKVFEEPSLNYPIEVGLISYTRNGREHKHREGENDLVELVAESVVGPAEPVVESVEDLSKEIVEEPVADLPEESEDIITVDTLPCEVPGYKDILFRKGQQWKTRGGEVVEITVMLNAARYAWSVGCNNGIVYTLKGKEYLDSTTDNDLVELVEDLSENLAEDLSEEQVVEPVDDNLYDHSGLCRLKLEDNTVYTLQETSVEDKMVEILHQLLAQRTRDLEKISLVFNTFIEMEKMK